MIRYERLQFDYDPYPIGLAPDVLDPDHYRSLCDEYPPIELFKHKPSLGNKYSLSEMNNPRKYRHFLNTNKTWGRFHDYIKSDEFIERTLDVLKTNFIDLGLERYRVVSKRRWGGLRANPIASLLGYSELSARFEFAMMNGQGGNIKAHTDAPQKLITLVFSMCKPNEWNPDWGGSTDVVWPKDRRRSFNRANRQMTMDQVDTVKKYEFYPNQAIVFIKTFNSWHAVAPMSAPSDSALRRTLTVNIERKL